MHFTTPNIQRMQKRRNIHGLVRALDHADLAIRLAAARALGELSDQRAIARLRAGMRQDAALEFQLACHAALTRISRNSSVPDDEARLLSAVMKEISDLDMDMWIENGGLDGWHRSYSLAWATKVGADGKVHPDPRALRIYDLVQLMPQELQEQAMAMNSIVALCISDIRLGRVQPDEKPARSLHPFRNIQLWIVIIVCITVLLLLGLR